ncbi:hypothetical protein SDC9_209824 [bioreactor metagenome]|uniref:Lactose transport system permease protein LacF n=1 Tax=bioreactor metagenome TaxID=1076179 RepID=A0A645JEC4_9ZZZZ
MLAYVYNVGFKDWNFSYAAAMSIMYLMFVLLFTGISYAVVSPRAGHAGERP